MLVPASCGDNSGYVIMREINVMPTLNSNLNNVELDLWLDINSIGSGLSNSQNFMYSLSRYGCEEEVVDYGSFNNKTNGGKINLLSDKIYSQTTTDTYYLYIWLDKDETSQATMDQLFDLSLNGNCTAVPRGDPFYAVYSSDDTSFRFYKENEGVINEGSLYNNLIATKVYKMYENDGAFQYDVSEFAYVHPWEDIRDDVTKIIIEDEISPKSIAGWFENFINVSYIDVTKLNTSNVVDMRFVFYNTGSGDDISNFQIIGLNNWNTAKVKNMDYMFSFSGTNATMFDIGDLSNWDVLNVKNMNGMFSAAGTSATMFDIGDLSSWDVSNVISMLYMYSESGCNSTTWSIGDLSNWDVSNVRNMSGMFLGAGFYSTTFDIGDLDNWDVSNVVDMYSMFYQAGENASNWSLDLSGWDVSNVSSYSSFNFGVTDKVIPPVWVN